MKKKINKFIKYIFTSCMILMIKTQVAFADVSFNSGQAKTDIQNLLNPVSNVLLWAALPLTGASIGLEYLSWNGKDEEEKENMPFGKVVKKRVIAFVLFGLTGAMLKWFSIS